MAFPLAGLLLSLAGKGVSSALSVKNNREAREAQQAESARRQAHYEAKANENPLSSSANQHIMGQYDRDAQQQIANAQNMATIIGATPEYAAAVQKGVAEGRANLMGQMSAGASARADKYDEKAEEARQEAAANEQEYHAQRNEQFGNLEGNALSAFGSLASASMSGGGESTEVPTGGGNGQSTSDKIKIAPLRAAQLQAGAEAATNPVEKQVLTDTANAASNTQKLATSVASEQNALAPGSAAKLTDGGYIQNADGTYTKDGILYYRNFDGSYAKVH